MTGTRARTSPSEPGSSLPTSIRLVELGILAPEASRSILDGRCPPCADGPIARGCAASRSTAWPPGDPTWCPVVRLLRRGRLRTVRRPRGRDVPTGQRPDRNPARAAHGDPRGDRDGGAVARRPAPRGRDGDRAVHRAPGRRGVPARRDRAPAPRRRRQHAPDRRTGGRLVDHRGDRASIGAAGEGPERIGNAELTDRIAPLSEQTVLAMYHAASGADLDRPTSSRRSRC